MKNKIKTWIYKLAKEFIVKRIINSTTPLTPQYLIERGWVKEFN